VWIITLKDLGVKFDTDIFDSGCLRGDREAIHAEINLFIMEKETDSLDAI